MSTHVPGSNHSGMENLSEKEDTDSEYDSDSQDEKEKVDGSGLVVILNEPTSFQQRNFFESGVFTNGAIVVGVAGLIYAYVNNQVAGGALVIVCGIIWYIYYIQKRNMRKMIENMRQQQLIKEEEQKQKRVEMRKKQLIKEEKAREEQLIKEEKAREQQLLKEEALRMQMQNERNEQEENLRLELQKLRESQQLELLEKQDEEERKIEERKYKILQELKSSKENVSDLLAILKTSIQKEKQNKNDYVDMDCMSMELDKPETEIAAAQANLQSLFETHHDRILSSRDVSDELNSITTFNKETEKVKAIHTYLESKVLKVKTDFGATPHGRLARAVKAGAVKLREENGLEIYKLPVKLVHRNETHKLRRYEVGNQNTIIPVKHVMVTGMTGAGKSLLVNNIVNYIYGVTYKDKFRFQLVVEEEELQERGKNASKCKAESMTSWVTSFCLHHQPGFAIEYSMILIDTPGFGDTRGIKFDELIIDQMRNFFDDRMACPVQELSCIGLVIQASQARITEEQKYIYDQVLNIFGRDMTENISLLFTFADAQPPPALEVVKKEEIPFNKDGTFKFNNSALYAPNNEISSDYSWVFGYDSLTKFFKHLAVAVPTNLNLTREVLKERDNLKTLLGNLQTNIDNGMNMLQTIENMINDILALDGTMRANKDHTIMSKRYPQTTKVVNHNITNCKPCMTTCHNPCYIAGDVKEGCASMLNGKCGICPGKCPWDMHSNGDRIYLYEEVEEEVKVEDMMEVYNIALTDKNAKKKLLLKMLEEYRCYRERVFSNIRSASVAAKRLEEIALRQTFLTNVSYIERLIQSEERSGRPNKKIRLEQLYYFKKMATTLSDAINSPNKLTGCVSNYESTIIEAIDNMKEEEDDYSQYFAYKPTNSYDSKYPINKSRGTYENSPSQSKWPKKAKKKNNGGFFGFFS